MSEFITAVRQYDFLQYALLAGLLTSVACGVVGTYVVTKRITFLSGGIAHTVLGGLGLAEYLRVVHGWAVQPLHGAIAAALLSAVIIGLVTLRGREREDTVIGALWAVGMAAGLLFISMTPGYSRDLMSYLFGNILMVGPFHLYLIAGLDVLVLLITGLFYKKFLAICFDDEFARLCGTRVGAWYLLLLCLAALTVVVLIQVVGLILVIALLTLPAAIAAQWVGTLRRMMLLATILGMIFTVGGLALSYGPDLPAGAVMILLAGGAYLLSYLVVRLIKTRVR